MGKTFFNSFIVADAALVLGACSGVSIPDVPGDTGTVKDCVGSAKKAHKTRHGTEELPPDTGDDKFTDKTIAYLDDFLDCAVGPAKTNEAKLLRGHAIVAVISRYAAYNAGAPVDGLPKNNFEPYDDLEDDVASTLASIEDAEYRLRVVSKVAKGDLKLRKDRPPYLHVKPAEFDLINAEYDEVQRIKRVLAVLRVFKNAAKPTYERGKRTFFRFAAAIGGSVSSARVALRDAAKGLQKYVVLHKFGNAYRAQVRKDLEEIAADSGRAVALKDWEKWDLALVDACDNMAKFIDRSHHCIPQPPMDSEGPGADTQ